MFFNSVKVSCFGTGFLILGWGVRVSRSGFFFLILKRKQSHCSHVPRGDITDCTPYTSNEKSHVWRASQAQIAHVCDKKLCFSQQWGVRMNPCFRSTCLGQSCVMVPSPGRTAWWDKHSPITMGCHFMKDIGQAVSSTSERSSHCTQ